MSRILSLEAGRGIAALAVVFHHASISSEAFSSAMPGWLEFMLSRGFVGVDFFFVLSGFIMHHKTMGRPMNWASGGSFYRKRLIRIFVPYLPIGIALALAYVALPGLSDGNRSWGWLSTLTLLPTTSAPALSVAWTLQHELVFYALFGAMIALNRIRLGMAIWCAVIVAAWIIGANKGPPISIFLSPLNLEFAFGIAAAELVASGKVKSSMMWIASGTALLAFLAMGADREFSILFGLASACAIVPICRLEFHEKLRPSRAWVSLGAASYSIYFVHNPLLALTSRVAVKIVDHWSFLLFAGVFASLILGSLYHLTVETYGRRFFSHKKALR